MLLGGDVCALYPSLDQIGTAEIAAEAVMETPIMFEDIDYDLLAVYILLSNACLDKPANVSYVLLFSLPLLTSPE